MSADNWAICPNCKRIREGNDEKTNRELQEAYGMVSADEYEERRRRTIEQVAKPLAQTFREDYYIGVDEDGTFSASYSGRCETCGASYEYKTAVEDAVKAPKTAVQPAPARRRR